MAILAASLEHGEWHGLSRADQPAGRARVVALQAAYPLLL